MSNTSTKSIIYALQSGSLKSVDDETPDLVLIDKIKESRNADDMQKSLLGLSRPYYNSISAIFPSAKNATELSLLMASYRLKNGHDNFADLFDAVERVCNQAFQDTREGERTPKSHKSTKSMVEVIALIKKKSKAEAAREDAAARKVSNSHATQAISHPPASEVVLPTQPLQVPIPAPTLKTAVLPLASKMAVSVQPLVEAIPFPTKSAPPPSKTAAIKPPAARSKIPGQLVPKPQTTSTIVVSPPSHRTTPLHSRIDAWVSNWRAHQIVGEDTYAFKDYQSRISSLLNTSYVQIANGLQVTTDSVFKATTQVVIDDKHIQSTRLAQLQEDLNYATFNEASRITESGLEIRTMTPAATVEGPFTDRGIQALVLCNYGLPGEMEMGLDDKSIIIPLESAYPIASTCTVVDATSVFPETGQGPRAVAPPPGALADIQTRLIVEAATNGGPWFLCSMGQFPCSLLSDSFSCKGKVLDFTDQCIDVADLISQLQGANSGFVLAMLKGRSKVSFSIVNGEDGHERLIVLVFSQHSSYSFYRGIGNLIFTGCTLRYCELQIVANQCLTTAAALIAHSFGGEPSLRSFQFPNVLRSLLPADPAVTPLMIEMTNGPRGAQNIARQFVDALVKTMSGEGADTNLKLLAEANVMVHYRMKNENDTIAAREMAYAAPTIAAIAFVSCLVSAMSSSVAGSGLMDAAASLSKANGNGSRNGIVATVNRFAAPKVAAIAFVSCLVSAMSSSVAGSGLMDAAASLSKANGNGSRNRLVATANFQAAPKVAAIAFVSCLVSAMLSSVAGSGLMDAAASLSKANGNGSNDWRIAHAEVWGAPKKTAIAFVSCLVSAMSSSVAGSGLMDAAASLSKANGNGLMRSIKALSKIWNDPTTTAIAFVSCLVSAMSSQAVGSGLKAAAASLSVANGRLIGKEAKRLLHYKRQRDALPQVEAKPLSKHAKKLELKRVERGKRTDWQRLEGPRMNFTWSDEAKSLFICGICGESGKLASNRKGGRNGAGNAMKHVNNDPRYAALLAQQEREYLESKNEDD